MSILLWLNVLFFCFVFWQDNESSLHLIKSPVSLSPPPSFSQHTCWQIIDNRYFFSPILTGANPNPYCFMQPDHSMRCLTASLGWNVHRGTAVPWMLICRD